MICIIGADGSGKTTLAHLLVKEMDQRNLPVKYVWFRLPYFFTFIILEVSKLFGFTRYLDNGSYTFTEYDFSRQPIKGLFSLIVLVDTLFYYVLKVGIPTTFGINVVCDRWIPDIIIDVSLDTNNPDFDQTLIGQAFNNLASKATLTVAVDASDRILQRRRPESALDPHVTMRRSLYRSYIQKYGTAILSSDCTITESFRRLAEIAIGAGGEFLRPKKIYGDFSRPWARPLLMRRRFVIAANWIFQGTLIMAMSERIFRFLLEITIAAISFALMSHSIPLVENVILSLFIAHTIDWSFNGNFWATQKFFGRKSDPKRLIDFLRKLQKREHPNVAAIAVFGSLSRGQLSLSSDLDMRVVRQKGLVSWMKTNLFVLRLRSMSFLKRLPIDILVMDKSEQIYEHINRHEMPVVVYDPNKILDKCTNQKVISLGDLNSTGQRS